MSTLSSKLKNLLSRKFLAAVSGIVSGIITVIQGQAVVGGSLIAVSIIGYMVAEGIIDAKAVASAASTVAAVATAVSAATDNEAVDTTAEIAACVSAELTATASADLAAAASTT